MRGEISGLIKGLKPSQIRALERIYRRRVDPAQVVSTELANFLAELSLELSRQLGVLINRRGGIEHVIVGDATKLMLPDVGRMRGAQGRFRGLRLVHTHLRGESLSRDDLTDLSLLRFDAIAAITIDEEHERADLVYVGHLLPDNPDGALWRELEPEPAFAQRTNFVDLITALEAEFARHAVLRDQDATVRAVLAHVSFGNAGAGEAEARIAELRELCRTAQVEVVDVVTQRRKKPDPNYLVGRGKLEQILLRTMQLGADLLIFDQDLTPGQARAISDFTDLKIVDRTMLILDIFAQHATSGDGKLQVELAQLRYALPRLVAKNTMMSRLAGGIGGRGPGETKLEVSRRRARDRIALLERKRRDVGKSRRLRRKRRGHRDIPVVAIVGYTNAGKSTLLNALTQGDAHAANKLFATLDPISRRLRFPREREVVLTDTVGFIRDLPPLLIEAFRATLEELTDADLLVQVVDASDDDYPQQVQTVEALLSDLELAEKPRVLAFNKTDRIASSDAARRASEYHAIPMSALDRSTLTPLLASVEAQLWKERV